MLQFKTSEVISDGKVNNLGTLKRSKVKSFKAGIFTQNQFFDKIDFFI